MVTASSSASVPPPINSVLILPAETVLERMLALGPSSSGSCFAIGGNLQKISHYIFIVTPSSVDISGDFLDILGGAYDGPLDSGM